MSVESQANQRVVKISELFILTKAENNSIIHCERGTWVAQSVECPTLDFGSGHDPRVLGLSLESPLH